MEDQQVLQQQNMQLLVGQKSFYLIKDLEIGAPKRCAEGVSKKGLAKLGIEPSPRWITKEIDGVRLTFS
ncbi:MAG: hypothetical protein V9F03_17320 [Microthrixaceae bacterium]